MQLPQWRLGGGGSAIGHAASTTDHAQFDHDPDYVPTIPERCNKFATGFDGFTTMPNAPTMDMFRDALATQLALAWN
jgi:hypothetical protein